MTMKKIIIFLVTTTIFLNACTSGNTTLLTPSQEVDKEDPAISYQVPTQGDCISPIVISGFYPGETAPTPVPKQDVLPVDWENVAKVPEKYKDKEAYIQLIRPRTGYDELWIETYSPKDLTETHDRLVYRTDTNEWQEAPQSPGFKLFLDIDQNIWMAAYSRNGSDPRFYRLDEKINQFIPVKDKANELSKGNIANSTIKTGSDGLFWFIFHNADDVTAMHEVLYSFNPVTLEAKSYSIGENFNSLEIDQNNNLYLMQNGETLIKFDPTTGAVYSVQVPPFQQDETSGGTSLYIDHEGRLWVSDRARYDTAVSNPNIGDPFILIRSSAFIEYVPYLSSYRWLRPTVMLESMDGRLWYNGDVWFDPNTGEWCHFTTYSSNIVEDSDNNLWMSADNQLYKLVLKK